MNITTADATGFIAALRNADHCQHPGRKLSLATINKVKRTLKAAIGVAVKQLGYLKVNPFTGIRQDKLPDVDVRDFLPAEFRRLLVTAGRLEEDRRGSRFLELERADPGTAASLRTAMENIDAKRLWWRTFVALCYTAGLRLNEVLNLIWPNVDFEADTVRVVAKVEIGALLEWQPKGKRMRAIPIPKLTIDLLVAMQAKATERNPYVLIPESRLSAIAASKQAGQWKEGRSPMNNVNRDWHRLAKLAEVSNATPHDLRRSCITKRARRLPIHVTQELAGHENITTTRKYCLSITEADREDRTRGGPHTMRSNPLRQRFVGRANLRSRSEMTSGCWAELQGPLF